MNIKICENEFINVEKLINFLKENLKIFYEESLEEYLEEVLIRYGETGNTNYELSSFYTKSKNPECYYYDIEIIEDKEYGTFNYKIIF